MSSPVAGTVCRLISELIIVIVSATVGGILFASVGQPVRIARLASCPPCCFELVHVSVDLMPHILEGNSGC